jgi:hypothetical protein
MRITEKDSTTLEIFGGYPDDTWRESMRDWFSEHGGNVAYRIPYMLNNLLIYWPKVAELNDPFDGSIQVAPNVSYDLVRERLQVLHSNESITPDEIVQISNVYGDGYLDRTIDHIHGDPDIGIEICRAATQRLLDKTRVLSFSENWDNILMWSHYADSHKGLCLGFTVSRRARDTDFKNVRYPSASDENERPTLDLSYEEFKTTQMAEKAIFVKSHDWKYEKEVRLVGPWAKDKYYSLHANRNRIALSEVIYGSKMSKEISKGVQRLIEHSRILNVKSYKAEMNKSLFVVDRKDYADSI